MRRRRGVAAGRVGIVIAAGIAAAAVALSLAGCITAPAPVSPTRHLPLGIPEPLVANCEQSVGPGGSAPVTAVWRDAAGLHVRVGLTSRRAGGSSGAMSATELALLSCLQVLTNNQPRYPTDSAGLLLQWKYSTTVLWPCFVAHDANLGETPTRAVFLNGDPLEMNPFSLLKSPLTDVQTLELNRDCPLVPSYLAGPTPVPAPSLYRVNEPNGKSVSG